MAFYIQDLYPDDVAWCYGCGRLNPHGLHLKTAWEDGVAVTRYTPDEKYTAIPGYVYGGFLASLVDCHSTGAAAWAAYLAQGHKPGDTASAPRFVTASLKVDYLKPTPMGVELVARGHIVEHKGRKVVVETEVWAGEVVVVRGHAVLVEMPPDFLRKPPQGAHGSAR